MGERPVKGHLNSCNDEVLISSENRCSVGLLEMPSLWFYLRHTNVSERRVLTPIYVCGCRDALVWTKDFDQDEARDAMGRTQQITWWGCR